jgi:predicted alpha-1,2-mannosidase
MKHAIFSIFIFLVTPVHGQISNLVNPFIGTGGHGHTFPGAVWPHGMVQLSPDTRIDGSWDGCSGYHYSDSVLYGFSHTHLSGTGVSDYGDVLLLPITAWKGAKSHTHQAIFAHEDESASPGYYQVKLLNADIQVELTTSNRVGFHRYHFPTNAPRMVLLDLVHRDDTLETHWEVTAPNAIRGFRRSSAWARNQIVCFAIEFSEPFQTAGLISGAPVAHFQFDPADRPLLVKVGLSYTTPEAAAANLQAEVPHWDFDRVRRQAQVAWEKELQRIQVFGGSSDEQIAFYTAIYHTMIHPTTASDVDGSYRGMDHKIYRDPARTHYTIFSLWDTFRALHPFFTIIDPQRAEAFVHTLLDIYKTGGRLPVWELAANETDCMIGYHSVSVFADAWAKGIQGFDADLALEAMVKSATWDHLGLPEYIQHGYLDVQHEHESVSKTLEYAYNDWCISAFASAIGEADWAAMFMERGQYWKNLFDWNTQFIRPKDNGSWQTPFDPTEVNNNFTEANAWQYTFFVPQDIPGLMGLMAPFTFQEQLDTLFATTSNTKGRKQVDITGLIGQYAHGNEPSHHMAYLYNYVHQPQKTRERVLQIMRDFYPNAPDGCIGNEDAGQMSAWLVFSAMGFYPVTPGLPVYATGVPLFDSIVLQLPGQRQLVITKASDHPETTLAPHFNQDWTNRLFIQHSEIMNGGHLAFKPTEAPVKHPPFPIRGDFVSMIAINPVFGPAPVVFDQKQRIALDAYPGHQIYFRMPNTDSTWLPYTGPFEITENTLIEARTINADGRISKTVQANYFKMPNNWQVKLHSTYNPQYHAGGPRGLVDGVRGSTNWRKGNWQGFQGQDFVVEIDLKKKQEISYVGLGFLQDTRSWIILPKQVSVWVSTNGRGWQQAYAASHFHDPQDMEPAIIEIGETVDIPGKFRYVRIVAENFGDLPEWHPGSGHPSFIFVDEVLLR